MACQEVNELILFYHPISYYSNRVVLALEEKGLEYKKVTVGLEGGNLQPEPWYRTINPRGEIPAICHGDRNVYDSDAIIDYLDGHFPDEKRLQAGRNSSEGDEIQQWRERINDIEIEIITFGCIVFRDILTKDAAMPAGISKLMKGAFCNATRSPAERENATNEMCMTLMEKNPQYSETQLAKLQRFQANDDLLKGDNGIHIVEREVEELDIILDEIESQLRETRTAFPDGDHWLLNQSFTSADIYLAVLLDRLQYLGLAHHYQDHMPMMTSYLKRLNQRKSFRVISAHTSRFSGRRNFASVVDSFLKIGLTLATGLGTFAAIAWVYYTDYFTKEEEDAG